MPVRQRKLPLYFNNQKFKYLRINANNFVAFFTWIGEDRLVTLDAVWMIITKNVSLSVEGFITLPTAEMATMPILVHRFRILATENQLQQKEKKNKIK